MTYQTIRTLRDQLSKMLEERPEMAEAAVEFTSDNGHRTWRLGRMGFDHHDCALIHPAGR